jgi:hypothetical protein
MEIEVVTDEVTNGIKHTILKCKIGLAVAIL